MSPDLNLLTAAGTVDYAAVDREVEAQLDAWRYQGEMAVARRRPMVFSVIEEVAKQQAREFRMTPGEQRVEAARQALACLDHKSDLNHFVREDRLTAQAELRAAERELEAEDVVLVVEAA